MIYNCYTDGACSNNGKKNAIGGYAYIILNENENVISLYKKKETLHPTNNKMEMLAVLKCCQDCQKIDDLSFDFNTFNIFTDSAYVQNCYSQKWYNTWKRNEWITSSKTEVLNKDLWKELIPFFEKNNYNFIKVAGHSNNEWNNKVDIMAVQARLEENKC